MATLPEAGQRLALPGVGAVQLDALVHRYPGKRLIFRGRLADTDRAVVVKLYLGRLRQWSEWRRGVQGARALTRAGVAAPALHHAGYDRQHQAWFCVLDWIEADEPWPPETQALPPEIHHRFLRTLAEHHRAGIQQNDMNWLNFIPRGGRLYAVDGDRVKWHRRPLNERQSLTHLLRIYASKSRLPESEVSQGYRAYRELRGWTNTEADLDAFLKDLRRARLRHAARVARRAARGWKHYVRFRTKGWVGLRDRRHLPLEAALNALDAPSIESAGDDRPTVTAPLPPPEGPLGRLSPRWLMRRQARRCWRNGLVLTRLQLPAPRPVAVAWSKRGGSACVIRWPIPDGTPLTEAIATADPQTAERIEAALRHLLQALAEHGIGHSAWRPEQFAWDGHKAWLMDYRDITLGRPGDPHLKQTAERAAARLAAPPSDPASGPAAR